MHLASAFADSAQKHAEKIALYWGEQEYSYAQLWGQSERVASELRQKLQVKAGDRVGLWLKNCPEFIPALFGILHAGAVVVPINNFLKPDEVKFILADAGIEVLITDAELGAHFPALKASTPNLQLLQIEELCTHRKPEPFAASHQSTDPPIHQSTAAPLDRKSTRLNSSHVSESRMPSSA